MGIPSGQRATCFIIGGVPFDLAKKLRNGKERYTVLNLPNAYTSETAAKVNGCVNIYKAIADATNCKQFVFDWDVPILPLAFCLPYHRFLEHNTVNL